MSGKKLTENTEHMIQKTMDVNVTAHFWTVRFFLQNMIDRNQGHIITIASLAG